MSQQQQPLDMNAIIRDVTQHAIQDAVPSIVASSLISAGNTLRLAGYQALGPVNDKQLLTKPALLSNNVSLMLVGFIRPDAGVLRLLITHVDGKRAFVAVMEVESDTRQSKFVTFTDEQFAELDRQLNALGMTYEGNAQLGLIIGEQPVEGYEYFSEPTADVKTEEAAPVSAENGADGLPAAAPSPAGEPTGDSAEPVVKAPTPPAENFSKLETGSVDPETPPI